MAYKTCFSCGGMGSLVESQRVPSMSGGMFETVQVRRSCSACGGTGSTFVPDPVTTDRTSNEKSGNITIDPSSDAPKKDFNETVAGWIFLGIWFVIGYAGITTTNLEWYWPVGIGFLVAFGTYRQLLKGERTLLKLLSKLVIFLLVGGAVLFVLYLISSSNT